MASAHVAICTTFPLRKRAWSRTTSPTTIFGTNSLLGGIRYSAPHDASGLFGLASASGTSPPPVVVDASCGMIRAFSSSMHLQEGPPVKRARLYNVATTATTGTPSTELPAPSDCQSATPPPQLTAAATTISDKAAANPLKRRQTAVNTPSSFSSLSSSASVYANANEHHHAHTTPRSFKRIKLVATPVDVAVVSASAAVNEKTEDGGEEAVETTLEFPENTTWRHVLDSNEKEAANYCAVSERSDEGGAVSVEVRQQVSQLPPAYLLGVARIVEMAVAEERSRFKHLVKVYLKPPSPSSADAPTYIQ